MTKAEDMELAIYQAASAMRFPPSSDALRQLARGFRVDLLEDSRRRDRQVYVDLAATLRRIAERDGP